MPEENLAELPEALPLKRVSPVWRVVTFIGGAVVLLLLFAVVSLMVLVARQERELTNARFQLNTKGAPLFPGPVVATINPADPDGGRADNGANLPYPVEADLHPGRAAPADVPRPGHSPHDRWLAKSREFWKPADGRILQQLTASPDGQSLAYFIGNSLVAGTFGNPLLAEEPEAPKPWTTRPGPGMAVFPPVPVRQASRDGPEHRIVGRPAWSADSRYVYFARLDGRMQRYDAPARSLETLAFRGSWPTPLPGNPQRLVLVRTQSTPQSDAPGAAASADPAEIVLGDCATAPGETRPRVDVLVSARRIEYSFPALSADGQQLAVWARPANTDQARVMLVALRQPKAEPEWLDIPATPTPRPLCWTRDGKHLVYAREQAYPLPPDCWIDADCLHDERIDLFQWNLAAKTETRLSRGGGCVSPTVDGDDGLFFLTWTRDDSGSVQSLRRIPLLAARAFAAGEPELLRRDGAAWAALIEQVWQDAKAPAGPRPELTGEVMGRLAAALERVFAQRCKEPLPVGLAGLDRLDWEVRTVAPRDDERRWRTILAAARGETLRKSHPAVWHLAPDRAPAHQNPEVESANAFALAVNLLGGRQGQPDDDDDDSGSPFPHWLLRRAEGRTLVLTNDARAARAEVERLVDPDLARGTDLLKQGKTKEGEQLLDALVRKPEHQRNYHLALAVGQLLYDHQRLEALQRLMEAQCIQQPADARKFNLLGLAQLNRQPREAAGAFKKSIRCDLTYGPGYLNLAQAYRLANDTPSGVACLRRYLELEPFGPQAADAARRLAELEAEGR
ncbi:MAG: hypothetical protein JNM56_28165 [Planctomycetia bacterium]|nr:hypothetical protein [Planctomycetia bacterium]